MGRRRSAATRDLPPNLYVRRGYYAWTDPRDGKVYSLGKDKRQAINEAIEANNSLTETLTKRAWLIASTATKAIRWLPGATDTKLSWKNGSFQRAPWAPIGNVSNHCVRSTAMI